MSIEESTGQPAQLCARKPSKAFYHELDKCIKLHDAFTRAIQIGRSEGFTDPQINDFIRSYFKNKIHRNTSLLWRKQAGLVDAVRIIEKETRRQALIDKSSEVKLPDDCQIYHGDFRNPEILKRIPDNSIDLLFVDPPYNEDSLPLYGSMAEVAVQKLNTGGNLVFYHGKNNLPRITKLLDIEGLNYNWEFCVLHTGTTGTVFPKKVFVDWKPLLWYVKGENPNIVDFTHDSKEIEIELESPIVSTPPEKILHDWQQSQLEVEYIIKATTVPNMKIVDLMTGSGTTGIAARRLGRQFIGIDISEYQCKIAKSNIASYGY